MDPQFSREKKEAVIGRLSGQWGSPVTAELLKLLLRKNRVAALPDLSKTYRVLSEDHRGVIEAEIALARPPRPELKKRIERYLESTTGKEVRVNYRVEPDLIGGIFVKMKNFMLDATVKTKLDRVNRHLMEARLG